MDRRTAHAGAADLSLLRAAQTSALQEFWYGWQLPLYFEVAQWLLQRWAKPTLGHGPKTINTIGTENERLSL
jgi:hypothetical protein